MTRVTFCSYDKPDSVGGPISWVSRLCPMLVQRGIEVRCLFILHWGESGPAVASLRASGISCDIASGIDRTEDRIRWILQKLNEHPPDVFVPNLVVAACFAARWAREAGIPAVGVLHSDDAFYRGIQDEFVFGSPRARLSAVVAVSRAIESEVRSRGPREVRVRRIPYGVDVPAERVRRNSDGLRIAYVGRLAEEQKRIADVTRALCRAVSEVDGVTAVMYGAGPDQNVVERILESEGEGLPVHLDGLVDPAHIQERLLSCDAILLLSDYEGLPIALLEAMACGCVPICSAMRSGIPELVVHEETGLIVNDRGDSVVNAVRRLRDHPELWARLSANARNRVSREFSAEASADRWAAFLSELTIAAPAPRIVGIPRKLRLPPVHPALASADSRTPSVPLGKRVYRNTRMLLGRVKQSLDRELNR